jgi:putative membrane protein
MSMSDHTSHDDLQVDQLAADAAPDSGVTPDDHADVEQASTGQRRHLPSTRTGRAWASLCAAVLAFVVLIVFMMQNTRSAEVSFLWMHGTIPLALALLIAAVGSALLTMVVGVARVTQLRRVARRTR